MIPSNIHYMNDKDTAYSVGILLGWKVLLQRSRRDGNKRLGNYDGNRALFDFYDAPQATKMSSPATYFRYENTVAGVDRIYYQLPDLLLSLQIYT